MDSPEKRRKRKRLARPSAKNFFTFRSLLSCLAFLTFLYLLSHRIPITTSSFRPVLVVSSLSLLSSSAVGSVQGSSTLNPLSPLRIEDRVLFPDHLLLLVSIRDRKDWISDKELLDCVYSGNISSFGSGSDEILSEKRDLMSVEEYHEFQLIFRCPLPPVNYSAAVNLQPRRRLHRGGARNLEVDDGFLWRSNLTVRAWDNMVYEAVTDGDTMVVFVKGLNLRPDRVSDPGQFSCHFGLGNWEREGSYVLATKAVTAAQEVIRCLLPRSIRKNRNKAEGIRVTIGVTPARGHGRVLVPSAAKISDLKSVGRGERNERKKYELCVCSMVWNQASSLREWIMYHAWLGVERWFIYDNNSDDGIKEVVEELEQEGHNVSRHLWPWIKTQEAGFSHCALRARDECNWVSFMDVDEFFYFPHPSYRHKRFRKLAFPGQNSLKTLVANVSSFPRIAEIRTACHSFGPSGLSSVPSQGVTVGYTCRLQSPERHKSIIRPDALDATLLNVVHHFHLRKGFRYMNLPQGTAVINHYKYQVWEAFRAKFYRRVATYVADWQDNQNEGSRDRAPGLGTEAIEPPNWRLQFCEVWDTGLRDFALANLADPATGLLPWERSPL
ncbi:hypothetical protein RJ639_041509 [Escallonia herrerae]|uniref:Glycosyltransferase family 92 protein n=1 Tax=Escallonia herrerae TaxID=1293975 RepID=A0AA88WV56_9ASTE|nr:hypothetical protein RJ639_041509 [Escallonia herrerae]